jgi:hypothetical protein
MGRGREEGGKRIKKRREVKTGNFTNFRNKLIRS